MNATSPSRPELPFDPLGPHRAQLRALRRAHPDVDLVLLPLAGVLPEPSSTAEPPVGVADRERLVSDAAAGLSQVEEVVGREADQQQECWQHRHLVLRAAHHELEPGESLAVLRRLLVRADPLQGWSALPVASRRPSLLVWRRGGGVRLRVRAWPRALTSCSVAGAVVGEAQR